MTRMTGLVKHLHGGTHRYSHTNGNILILSSQAFPKGHTTLDSDDNISVIHAQCAGKAKHLSTFKSCVAEAIEFTVLPPTECKTEV